MNLLHQRLYKLLLEIDEICSRNDIEYYLGAGTALGAIRGGGFLPWDDDIDLYITEKNWQKLVKVMETETPEDRIFVCTENDEYYRNVVGRYVDTTTTVMMRSQMVCGKACGQLIEFFIFDPMPLDEEAKRLHKQKVKIYAELLTSYFVVNRNIFYSNDEFDFDLYKKYRKRCEKEGYDKVLTELLSEIKSNDEDSTDSYCMRWGQRNLIYGKELFGKPRPELFEDRMLPVPAIQEKVARIAYGDDWMYIPEGAGKIVHDLDKDLDTPFQQYVDMYMSVYNKDDLYNSFLESKNARADALVEDNMFKMKMGQARAKLAGEHLKRSLPSSDETMNLLEEGHIDEVLDIYSYFFEEQALSSLSGQGIRIPVSDEHLYIAIMATIVSGSYFRISKLLKFREETGIPLTEDLLAAKKLYEFCQRLSVLMFDEMDPGEVTALLESNSEYARVVPDYARGKMWVLKKTEAWANLNEEGTKWLKIWPKDGEIMSYMAYALNKLNRHEEAKSMYKSAVSNTRNGFVWREANEIYGIDGFELIDNKADDKEMM